jgi:7-keto-8-aminopelargonate synthetase-like enzyme
VTFVPFVIPVSDPAVPMNAHRVRLNVTTDQSYEDIDAAGAVLARFGRDLGPI